MTKLEIVQLELNKERIKNKELIEALRQLYGAVWKHLETVQEEREIDLERRYAECQ